MAILEAVERVKNTIDFEVYLYRGAWQEWSIEMVDVAVPLNPKEVLDKREAIFKH